MTTLQIGLTGELIEAPQQLTKSMQGYSGFALFLGKASSSLPTAETGAAATPPLSSDLFPVIASEALELPAGSFSPPDLHGAGHHSDTAYSSVLPEASGAEVMAEESADRTFVPSSDSGLISGTGPGRESLLPGSPVQNNSSVELPSPKPEVGHPWSSDLESCGKNPTEIAQLAEHRYQSEQTPAKVGEADNVPETFPNEAFSFEASDLGGHLLPVPPVSPEQPMALPGLAKTLADSSPVISQTRHPQMVAQKDNAHEGHATASSLGASGRSGTVIAETLTIQQQSVIEAQGQLSRAAKTLAGNTPVISQEKQSQVVVQEGNAHDAAVSSVTTSSQAGKVIAAGLTTQQSPVVATQGQLPGVEKDLAGNSPIISQEKQFQMAAQEGKARDAAAASVATSGQDAKTIVTGLATQQQTVVEVQGQSPGDENVFAGNTREVTPAVAFSAETFRKNGKVIAEELTTQQPSMELPRGEKTSSVTTPVTSQARQFQTAVQVGNPAHEEVPAGVSPLETSGLEENLPVTDQDSFQNTLETDRSRVSRVVDPFGAVSPLFSQGFSGPGGFLGTVSGRHIDAPTAPMQQNLFQHTPEADSMIGKSQIIDQVFGSFPRIPEQGVSRLTIQLHPEELGQVTLKVAMEMDRVHVQMQAQTREVQDVLENHLPRLREALEGQGLKLDDLQVSVGSGKEEGKGLFGEQRQSHHQGRSPGQGTDVRSDGWTDEERKNNYRPLHEGGLSMRV